MMKRIADDVRECIAPYPQYSVVGATRVGKAVCVTLARMSIPGYAHEIHVALTELAQSKGCHLSLVIT